MQDETDIAAPSPWTRPGFIVAAVFVAVLAALAIVIAVGPDGEKGPTGAPTSAPLSSPTGPPVDASGEAALPTILPTRPPADVSWQLAGQNSVPTSAATGPRSVDAGVASGYARTPEGALVAAAQLAARSAFSAGRASWEPTVQRQFVPGADRDRLLANLRSTPEQSTEPGELSPLVGFIYQAYTPDTAVIELVYRAPGAAATYHVLTTTMQWRDGDWRMTAPAGGSWLSANRQATSLAGVVPWGNR